MEVQIFGAIVVTALAVVATCRTRIWWLPGVVLLVVAVVVAGGVLTSDEFRDHDPTGLEGLGNAVLLAGAAGAGVVGALLVGLTALIRSPRAPARVRDLPPIE